MTRNKVGPNEPCPCGSGVKYKKCCRASGEAAGYGATDRASAIGKLLDATSSLPDEFVDEAHAEFWGDQVGREDELGDALRTISSAAFEIWLGADYEVTSGKTVVDVVLEQASGLTTGERAFFTALRRSPMHLYEIEGVVPGVSITLRDVLERTQVTVAEPDASRAMTRGEWLVVRVLPRGVSGKPEMVAGAIPIPRSAQEPLREVLTELRDSHLTLAPDDGLAAFYAELPAVVHEIWIGAVTEPMRGAPVAGGTPEMVRVAITGAYDTHARGWVDQPNPALGGATPREASKRDELRGALGDLVWKFVARCLRPGEDGHPLYDASWMWTELGIEDEKDVVRPLPSFEDEKIGEIVTFETTFDETP